MHNKIPSSEIYKPSDGSWTATASMAVPRSGHTSTLLADGTVLVAGGFSATTGANAVELRSAERYVTATNTWLPVPDMAGARALHSATLLKDGRVLVVGIAVNSLTSTAAELYEPKTNTWLLAASPRIPRIAHTATLLDDGRVLIVGGSGGGQPGYLTSAELYDPAHNSWSPAASTLAPHSQQVVVNQGR